MAGLFQTLLRPDREEDPERAEVAKAANLLQIGEFQLLQLAYYEWYGEDLPIALVDRLFAAYMLHGVVPPWARHYARHILEKDARGFIDPHDRYYHRYDSEYVTHVPEGLATFCKVTAVLIMFIAGAVWVAQLASAGNVPFQFPPFVESPEDFQTNP